MESRSKSILVVDDDRDLLTLVAFVLESEGYQVETSSDGQQGLEAVSRGMPGLILLDMKMPVMDGWAFAREYHSRHNPGAPIVVLTAADDAKRRAEEIGAAGWIGKPFDLDALVAVVGRYVQKG
ncbi:MAG: response regulator [Chloroflexota bacterium]